jgi:hypothetical protein
VQNLLLIPSGVVQVLVSSFIFFEFFFLWIFPILLFFWILHLLFTVEWVDL